MVKDNNPLKDNHRGRGGRRSQFKIRKAQENLGTRVTETIRENMSHGLAHTVHSGPGSAMTKLLRLRGVQKKAKMARAMEEMMSNLQISGDNHVTEACTWIWF